VSVLPALSVSIALSRFLGGGLLQAGPGDLEGLRARGTARLGRQPGPPPDVRSGRRSCLAGHWLQPCSSWRWERRKGRGLAPAHCSCRAQDTGDGSSPSRCKCGAASGLGRTCQKRSRSPLVFPKQRKQPCIAGSRVLGLCWLVIIR